MNAVRIEGRAGIRGTPTEQQHFRGSPGERRRGFPDVGTADTFDHHIRAFASGPFHHGIMQSCFGRVDDVAEVESPCDLKPCFMFAGEEDAAMIAGVRPAQTSAQSRHRQ